MQRFLTLAFVIIWRAVVLLAQTDSRDPDPPVPVIKATVRQVLVPVVITDKTGRYVSDLTAPDFSLYEDDVPQKIVAFSRGPISKPEESVASPETLPPVHRSALNESPVRTYLICIDTLHSGFDNYARVRKALKEFFAHEEPGDSQYALFALGRELHVLVDSTRDPAAILSALGDKSATKAIHDSEAVNLANEVQQFVGLVGTWCGGCQCSSVQMDMANTGCPGYKARVRSELLSFSERAAILNETFLRRLITLVNAMSSMPTRRTVLFISDGFNRFAGQELTTILRAYSVADPNLTFNQTDLQPRVNELLKLAVRDNVRFYTLDSRGLYTGSMVPGTGEDASSRGVPQNTAHAQMSVAWQNTDALAELAKATGGAFYENSNDLLRGIRRAFADGREEYVLAYVPSNTAYDGNFRKITVKIKDKDFNIAAKQGYWANP
jgi:VWFA-related protein